LEKNPSTGALLDRIFIHLKDTVIDLVTKEEARQPPEHLNEKTLLKDLQANRKVGIHK